ncbi:MAG: hypothetical protein SV760_00035 [Halobacteria archaeon]|nr:hypothetical protein [Halobacteria archaeon]
MSDTVTAVLKTAVTVAVVLAIADAVFFGEFVVDEPLIERIVESVYPSESFVRS